MEGCPELEGAGLFSLALTHLACWNTEAPQNLGFSELLYIRNAYRLGLKDARHVILLKLWRLLEFLLLGGFLAPRESFGSRNCLLCARGKDRRSWRGLGQPLFGFHLCFSFALLSKAGRDGIASDNVLADWGKTWMFFTSDSVPVWQ